MYLDVMKGVRDSKDHFINIKGKEIFVMVEDKMWYKLNRNKKGDKKGNSRMQEATRPQSLIT